MSAAIGKAKDNVLSAAEFAQMAGNFYEQTIANVYVEYEKRKLAAGALDFDDLITETVRLFRDHPAVLEHYQEWFRYILVDEYQDTNRAQYQLVNLLAAKYRNVCVVGDADQGVYSWRGATIQNLLDFERDYPDAEVFLMEQNYRSTSNILAIANALIEHNVQRKPKSLWTETTEGELAVRFRADDEHEEALFVAEETHRLVEDEAHRYSDVAVFYRTNAQSRVLEDIFMRAGIPYRVVGGVRFYQRKEVKDILAYLRLLLNPQDVVSARRVVNTPKRGIGDATVAALEGFAALEQIPFLEATRRADELPELGARAKGAIAGFVGVMQRLQEAYDSGAGPQRMVEAAATESGYLLELEAERTVEAEGRIENLRELGGVAAEFEQRSPDGALAEFLEQVSLVSEQDEYDEEAGERDADDAPQREGARVPRGLHHRPGGRRVPALPLDGRSGAARGGAPADVRRGDPSPRTPLPDVRLEPDAVRLDVVQPAVEVPRRDPERAREGARGGRHRRPRRRVGLADPGGRRGPARDPADLGGRHRSARQVGRGRRPHRERLGLGRGGDGPVRGRGGEAAAGGLRPAAEGRLT